MEKTTHNFLSLLHTRLHLGKVSLRFIIDAILEFGLADDAQALLGVQLPLSNMPGSRGTC